MYGEVALYPIEYSDNQPLEDAVTCAREEQQDHSKNLQCSTFKLAF